MKSKRGENRNHLKLKGSVVEEVLMEAQEKWKNKKKMQVCLEKEKNTLRIIITVEGVHNNTKLNNQQQLAFIEDLTYVVYQSKCLS